LQGWEGFRAFRVSRQDSVTNSTKLLLEPVDGKEVCVPDRGQFVCMRIDVNGFGSVHQNITIGPAIRTFSDGQHLSARTSKSLNAQTREPTNAYETVLSKKGSRDSLPLAIPMSAVETSLIVAGAVKEGAIMELSVPLGGGSHIDKNEAHDALKSNLKVRDGSLLKTAMYQNKKVNGLPDDTAKVAAANPLVSRFMEQGTPSVKRFSTLD
jgi:hypothetical protein